MLPPRFVLVITAESNLLRAALVTRELKSVASARQPFQVVTPENGTQEFDPAEVWYKMKKVIAACLDIGRTLSREIAGVAIVGETNARVVWSQQVDEVVSSGTIEPTIGAVAQTMSGMFAEQGDTFSGTLATWLLWNLTGGAAGRENQEFGKTRARAPFDAELPIVTVLEIEPGDPLPDGGQGVTNDDPILEAANIAWKKLESGNGNEFARSKL